MFSANFFMDHESQITLLAAVAIAAVVAWLLLFVIKRVKNQEDDGGEILGHEWDGIAERNNSAPKMMHVLMVGGVLFSLWYGLVGYPLGSFSQITQYNQEIKDYQETFDKNWDHASEEDMLSLGESLFNSKCVSCHGYTGDGQGGKAADLVAFGGVNHVIYVLKNGSKGMGKLTPEMPALYVTLGETEEAKAETAQNLAAYVVSLSGRTAKMGNSESGKEAFDLNCIACHGEDGKGNGMGGMIPNMAADLSQYGTAPYVEAIIRSGKKGHIGQMPSFEAEGTLSDIQYKALSLFVAKGLVEN
ncbi:MAG: c-type cytochrome [SAR324 cluster bacterium]|nr:c-type cytochrome [SAR324 cluster bacterium]